MSCCGTPPAYDELDEVSRLVSQKLAAFLRTLRDNAFAVGLQEGQDAAALDGGRLCGAARPAALRVQASVLGAKVRLGKIRWNLRCVLARQARALALDDVRFDQSRQQPVA